MQLFQSITIFFLSDFNVEAFVTHMDEKSESLQREQIAIPLFLQNTVTHLNNSRTSALEFAADDMVRVDVNLDIKTTTGFSVILAVLKEDDCSNYDVMAELQSTKDCSLGECQLQSDEIDDSKRLSFVRYCRFGCARAS